MMKAIRSLTKLHITDHDFSLAANSHIESRKGWLGHLGSEMQV
jgi:hypothetical protein